MHRTKNTPFPQELLNRSSLDDPHILSGQFWGELRVFLAVAKSGSFSRAAALLATSQPTVSRQVKRLQDQLGAQLLVSSQVGVRLTSKGEQLARSLAELDQSLFMLSNDLRAESGKEEGLVRISITDGLGVFFLIPALEDFARAHPRIQVSLQNSLNLNDLRQSQTDLMIGFAPVQSSDVTTRTLGMLHLVPMASRAYVERYGVPELGNLERHKFIQTGLYMGNDEVWAPWNSLVGKGQIAHYSENSFTYGMMVKAGLGIGLLGSYTVMEPAARPIDLKVHIPIRLCATVLAGRLASRPVQLAFNWICEIFGSNNLWFSDKLTLAPKPNLDNRGFRLMFNLPAD